MVVTVGADHVSQHLGVTGIGLGSRGRVTVPISRGGHRVHREHQVARCDQRGDEQPSVGSDPDDHLRGIINMDADHVVEPAYAFHSFRQATAR